MPEMTDSRITAVILANGSFPGQKLLKSELSSPHHIICCDGAVQKLVDHKLQPDIIIGDLDSISADLKTRFSNILIHKPDQNQYDLEKALNWVIEQGYSRAVVLGASGLRDDHALGNIFQVLSKCRQIKCQIVTDYGTFLPVIHTRTFQSKPGQPISIFSPDPSIRITTENLKYNFNNSCLPNLYSGVSNTALQDQFKVTISHSAIMVYLVNHEE